jgi:hypothetical protein
MPSSFGTGALVVLQAGSGLRIQEPLGLNISDLEFVGRTTEAESQSAPGRRGYGSTQVDTHAARHCGSARVVAGSAR